MATAGAMGTAEERNRELYSNQDIRDRLQEIVEPSSSTSLSADAIVEMLSKAGAVYFDGHFVLLSGYHTNTFLRFASLAQFPHYIARLGSDMARWVLEESLRPQVILAPASAALLAYEAARVLNSSGEPVPLRVIYAEVDGATGAPKADIAHGFRMERHERVFIVNDMTTTGKGLETLTQIVGEHGATVAGFGLFARRDPEHASLIRRVVADYPLYFTVTLKQLPLWTQQECRLCDAEVPKEYSKDLNRL